MLHELNRAHTKKNRTRVCSRCSSHRYDISNDVYIVKYTLMSHVHKGLVVDWIRLSRVPLLAYLYELFYIIKSLIYYVLLSFRGALIRRRSPCRLLGHFEMNRYHTQSSYSLEPLLLNTKNR